jgi:aminopeptidase N
VDYYEPQGWVDLSIYDAGGYRAYRDAVYLNGMKFLLDLRNLVGAEVFAAFLQDYLARNTQKLATADGFFRILSEHSNADWSALKAEYFQNP